MSFASGFSAGVKLYKSGGVRPFSRSSGSVGRGAFAGTSLAAQAGAIAARLIAGAKAMRDDGQLRLEGEALGIARRASELAPWRPTPKNVKGSYVHLRESARVQLRREGNQVIARIIFDRPYAWVQHERVDYRHPHGGEARYLEKALVEGKYAIPKRMFTRAELQKYWGV